MKIKKMIIFTFIFLLIFSICGTSFASMTIENNNSTIILKDIEINSENYLILCNEDLVELIVAEQGNKLYFDRVNSRIYSANPSKQLTNFKYYYSVLNENIAGDWSTEVSKDNIIYANKSILRCIGSINPMYRSRRMGDFFFDNLPENTTWNDNFCIFYSDSEIHLVLATGEGVWLNTKRKWSRFAL